MLNGDAMTLSHSVTEKLLASLLSMLTDTNEAPSSQLLAPSYDEAGKRASFLIPHISSPTPFHLLYNRNQIILAHGLRVKVRA